MKNKAFILILLVIVIVVSAIVLTACIGGNSEHPQTYTVVYADASGAQQTIRTQDVDLTAASNFSNWDTSIWDIADGQYPKL